MEHEFWNEMWEVGRLGFHLEEVNSKLAQFHAELAPKTGRGLVPLCGKSLDLVFLAQQGHEVVGVEFVRAGVEAFFRERGVDAETQSDELGTRLSAGGVTIWNSDFFVLSPEALGRFQWVFDRAALVAIDPKRREEYVARIASLLDSGGRLLLVTLGYPQQVVSGPPFNVGPDDVRRLYGQDFEIKILAEDAATDLPPRFVEAGLSQLTLTTWLLTRR